MELLIVVIVVVLLAFPALLFVILAYVRGHESMLIDQGLNLKQLRTQSSETHSLLHALREQVNNLSSGAAASVAPHQDRASGIVMPPPELAKLPAQPSWQPDVRYAAVPDMPMQSVPEPIQVSASMPPVSTTLPIPGYLEPPIAQPGTEPDVEVLPELVIAQLSPAIPATIVDTTGHAVPSKPSFSWERFVGENLVNKLGIAILTIGIGIFVKHAIDQSWINALGRVFIGLAAGCVLGGTGHFLRQDYKAFSSVLIGGALTVFYFTVGLAYNQYELLSHPIAFALMVGITVIGVAASYSYNKIELAVIAWIGGFFTPFLLQAKESNYLILLTYVLILNMGMLALAYNKRWRLLYLVAFVSTTILYDLGFGHWVTPENAWGVLGFGVAYYFVFVAATLLFNVRTGTLFKGEDLIQLLAINLGALAAGREVLSVLHLSDYHALVPAALAAMNIALALVLKARKVEDGNLIYVVYGLIIALISIFGLNQFSGNYITLFWAIEAVMLLALYRRSTLAMVYYSSWLLLFLAGCSWIEDAYGFYNGLLYSQQPDTMILNDGFISGIVLTVTMALFFAIHSRLVTMPKLGLQNKKQSDDMLLILVVTIFYVSIILEVGYHLFFQESDWISWKLRNLGFIAVSALYLAGSFYASNKFKLGWELALTIVTGILFLLLLTIGYFESLTVLKDYLVNLSRPGWHFGIQYGGIIGFVSASYFVVRHIGQSAEYRNVLYIVAGIIGLVLLSQQLNFATALFVNPDTKEEWEAAFTLSNRVVYPIAWGMVSFGLLVIGMVQKVVRLRIMGLAIFCLALVKLFLLDVWHMSPSGRIAAFISLGVLLLVVSFLYQKLRRLVVEEG